MTTGTIPPLTPKTPWRSNFKGGTTIIDGRPVSFDSRYERNWALWLQYCKEDGLIADWVRNTTHFRFTEPVVYEAHDGDERTVGSYVPDFLVIDPIGRITLQEVKGWQPAKFDAQLVAMARDYPRWTIEVIRKPDLLRVQKRIHLDGWEEIR